MGKLVDLTGQKFGRLTVLRKDFSKKEGHAYWICQCECGNIISVRSNNLKNGNTNSCGCFRKETASNLKSFDLINQRFGLLTVLKRDFSRTGKNAYWICQCDCGKIISVDGSNLKRGRSISCGCYKKSKGEEKIENILNELNIQYETQKQFPNLFSINNGKLRFDFYLPLYNIVLEYQGKQHYTNIEYWGGEKGLQDRQTNDNIKRQWCKENNIKLIEIPYWDFDKLNENYLKQLI